MMIPRYEIHPGNGLEKDKTGYLSVDGRELKRKQWDIK